MAENARTTEPMLVAIGLGLGASLFLATLSFVFAGAGHGTYVPMILSFPFAMLLAVLHGSIEAPHIALGFLQFPIYGALLVVARSRRGWARFWAALGLLHVVAIAVAMFVAAKRGNFL